MSSKNLLRIALTGASGYLGNQLYENLIKNKKNIVYPLYRKKIKKENVINSKIFYGDLLEPNSVSSWLTEGCNVVHMAYMWNAGRIANLQATNSLINVCVKSKINRLIHISTAAVYGRVRDSFVNEDASCKPYSEYAKTKFEIENLLQEASHQYNFELVILRPTSIFGINGFPLTKLYSDLNFNHWIVNYLRSCVFGQRAMNLVHIDYVISAIRFAIESPINFRRGIYNVSNDYSNYNNFRDVEKIAKKIFDMPNYPLPVIPLPSLTLDLILRIMRRNIINSNCRFDDSRLRRLGFDYSELFEKKLEEYFSWAKSNQIIC